MDSQSVVDVEMPKRIHFTISWRHLTRAYVASLERKHRKNVRRDGNGRGSSRSAGAGGGGEGLSGSYDCTLRVWDAARGEGRTDLVSCVCVVTVGSGGGRVRRRRL